MSLYASNSNRSGRSRQYSALGRLGRPNRGTGACRYRRTFPSKLRRPFCGCEVLLQSLTGSRLAFFEALTQCPPIGRDVNPVTIVEVDPITGVETLERVKLRRRPTEISEELPENLRHHVPGRARIEPEPVLGKPFAQAAEPVVLFEERDVCPSSSEITRN